MNEKRPEQLYLSTPVDGKDEMNLAEFPFSVLSKRVRPDKKTIEFSDMIPGFPVIVNTTGIPGSWGEAGTVSCV